MKVYLTYSLPDEREDFLTAFNGIDYKSVLWDLDNWLRNEIKYKERYALQEIRDKLNDLCEDRSIDLM